jgi:hypothetical protein
MSLMPRSCAAFGSCSSVQHQHAGLTAVANPGLNLTRGSALQDSMHRCKSTDRMYWVSSRALGRLEATRSARAACLQFDRGGELRVSRKKQPYRRSETTGSKPSVTKRVVKVVNASPCTAPAV